MNDEACCDMTVHNLQPEKFFMYSLNRMRRGKVMVVWSGDNLVLLAHINIHR